MARGPLPDRVHASTRAVRAKERQRANRRKVAERAGLPPQAITAILIGLLFVGLITAYVLTRPSPQEQVVKRFFTAVQAGRYEEAVATLDGGSFHAMAQRSTARVSSPLPGLSAGPMPLSTLLADEAFIQTWIPSVPRHTSPFDFQKLKVQRDRERERKLVQFKIVFAISEQPGGPLSAPSGTPATFTLDGTATVVNVDGDWKVRSLEFMIIPRRAKDLQVILRFMGGDLGGF